MQYAKETLVYYLKTVWEEAGLRWNTDNENEVEGIIQSIEHAVDNKLNSKTYSEEMRQKIASEQLAALVLANPDATEDTYLCAQLVERAELLTNLLLRKLAEKSRD